MHHPSPPPPGQGYQPPQSSHSETEKPPQDGIPYIGSRISLISKTDIRYEGFLFNIDTRQSMVALQHVRSFGTEGRRAERIPPSETVLPYATFKASEIKDLHVCEAAPSAPVPAPPPPIASFGYASMPTNAPPPPVPSAPPLPSPPTVPPPPSSPQRSQPPASPTYDSPKAVRTQAQPTLLTPGSTATTMMMIATTIV